MVTTSTEDRALFKKLRFHSIILDEAHMLKNMASQRYENLMKIKVGHALCHVYNSVNHSIFTSIFTAIFLSCLCNRWFVLLLRVSVVYC